MSRQASFGQSFATCATLEDGLAQVEAQESDSEEKRLLAELEDWSRVSMHRITQYVLFGLFQELDTEAAHSPAASTKACSQPSALCSQADTDVVVVQDTPEAEASGQVQPLNSTELRTMLGGSYSAGARARRSRRDQGVRGGHALDHVLHYIFLLVFCAWICHEKISREFHCLLCSCCQEPPKDVPTQTMPAATRALSAPLAPCTQEPASPAAADAPEAADTQMPEDDKDAPPPGETSPAVGDKTDAEKEKTSRRVGASVSRARAFQARLIRAAKMRINRMVKPKAKRKDLEVPQWFCREWAEGGCKENIAEVLLLENGNKACGGLKSCSPRKEKFLQRVQTIITKRQTITVEKDEGWYSAAEMTSELGWSEHLPQSRDQKLQYPSFFDILCFPLPS